MHSRAADRDRRRLRSPFHRVLRKEAGTSSSLLPLAVRTPLTTFLQCGWCSCWWQNSKEINQLLNERGISYDHSSQAHDCSPHYSRDYSWHKVDYSKPASTWMKPLERGKLLDLVQVRFPCSGSFLPPRVLLLLNFRLHFPFTFCRLSSSLSYPG
jgi:hypothetical protein